MKISAAELLSRYAAGERNFAHVDLRRQKLRQARLAGISLRGADLRGTDFREAELVGVDFTEARLGVNPLVELSKSLFFALVSSIILLMLIILLLKFSRMVELPIRHLSIAIPGSFLLIPLLIGFDKTTKIIIISVTCVLLFGGILAFALPPPDDAASFAISAFVAIVFGVLSMVFSAFLIRVVVAIGWICAFSTILMLSGFIITDSSNLVFIVEHELIAIFLTIAILLALKLQPVLDQAEHPEPSSYLMGILINTSAGTKFQRANLTDADFLYTDLGGVNFRQANLFHTKFFGAKNFNRADFSETNISPTYIQMLVTGTVSPTKNYYKYKLTGLCLHRAQLARVSFAEANLRAADLRTADLTDAVLTETVLCDAWLDQTNLRGADLRGADLRGARLREVLLDGATLNDARIDVRTYRESGFAPEQVVALRERGIKIIGLEDFPETVQSLLQGGREGLTLSFRTRLRAFDRYLIDGVVFGVLGRDTDCEVVELRNQGDRALVRLLAGQRADLERVAEALYSRVWELELAQDAADQQSLAHRETRISPQTLRAGLDEIRRRLQHMELREQAALAWAWPLDGPDPAQGETGTERLLGPQPATLLICHAPTPQDRMLAMELVLHLRVLERQGLLAPFSPDDVLPGSAFEKEWCERLDAAAVVILLVSADWFADPSCHAQELVALARLGRGALVIPVLVRPITITGTALAELRPLPEDGVAVTMWNNRDAAWDRVVSGLRRALLGRSLTAERPRAAPLRKPG